MSYKIVKKRNRIIEKNQMKHEKIVKTIMDLIKRANGLQAGRKAKKIKQISVKAIRIKDLWKLKIQDSI